MEALLHRPALKVKEVMDILDRKSVLPILKKMLEQEWIILQEEVYSTYKPKTVKYIFLNKRYKDDEQLKKFAR
ncbi:helicase PriA [Nonlabens ulvanivorans]|uniref:Helicase PriA n=1 Tax=Nonlabens ulvanivorans TaxID=906888 RepID=A0A090WHR1_NONUL|nr:helicase PriA [Nonlabens ulvanivorans]